MSNNIYIQNEAKNGFKGWTRKGLGFLLQNEDYKHIAIDSLSKRLEHNQEVEFVYNNLHYEIFSSVSGYAVNIYSSGEKDEDGDCLEQNIIDGGLCIGSSQDAIEFML